MGSPSTLATPFVAHQLVWTGEAERARAVLARLRAWLGPREESNAAEAAWYLALLEWRAGNWAAAVAAAEEAVGVTRQFGRESSTITSWPSAVMAAHRGEVDRAGELAERGLGATGRPGVAEAGYEWVLGFVALSLDDVPGALEHLSRADRILAELGIREPALLWHMPDLLDALLAAGDADGVEQALAPWEGRARALDRAWALAIAARTRALLAAIRGDLDAALAGFEQALSSTAGQTIRSSAPGRCSRSVPPAAREAAARRQGNARAGDCALRRPAGALVGRQGAGRARTDRRACTVA